LPWSEYTLSGTHSSANRCAGSVWCGSFIVTHDFGSLAPEPERDVLLIDAVLTGDPDLNL
jgi:hypothetical protein